MVIAGGTGFIGRHLARALSEKGYDVVVLTRRIPDGSLPGIRFVQWDGAHLGEWAKQIDGALAVVNLIPEAPAYWLFGAFGRLYFRCSK